MAIAVGSFVRFRVGTEPPPGVSVNANSAMVVVSILTTGSGGEVLRLARQATNIRGESKSVVGDFPTSLMIEVRAP
jgi:hypothetical protein